MFRTLIMVLFSASLLYSTEVDFAEPLSGYLPGGLEIKAVRWYSNSPEQRLSTLNAQDDPYKVDSPSIVGYTPYVATVATNQRMDQLEYFAEKDYSPRGSYLVSDPNENYVIGIFDTGASTAVFGYENSRAIGIKGAYLTSNYITIGGISGFVDTIVTQPIGVYLAGLSSIDEDGFLELEDLVGLSNFSVLVGDEPIGSAPDLPTVIGCPMAASWTVAIDPDTLVQVSKDGNDYVGPKIDIFDYYDPSIPQYENNIPLELRPLGATSIAYIPGLDDIFGGGGEFNPSSPSVLAGNSSQSLMFIGAVDLENNGSIAYDKSRFMFDTGAQSTLIGNRVAARLGLNPSTPDFELYAMGVTGEVVLLPGFVIDKITIPALGNWLEFTNVPVVLQDVASPEGGTLDGIIGTNLFNNFKIVLNGGGFGLTDDPSIDFAPRMTNYIPADFAPDSPDGTVDYLDLEVLISVWLSEFGDPNWQQRTDLAPYPVPDDIVNMLDFAEFASQWKEY